jgi:hypothetical protein
MPVQRFPSACFREFPCVRDTQRHGGEGWGGKRKHVKNRITRKIDKFARLSVPVRFSQLATARCVTHRILAQFALANIAFTHTPRAQRAEITPRGRASGICLAWWQIRSLGNFDGCWISAWRKILVSSRRDRNATLLNLPRANFPFSFPFPFPFFLI